MNQYLRALLGGAARGIKDVLADPRNATKIEAIVSHLTGIADAGPGYPHLKKVGFWRQKGVVNSPLPDPSQFVDPSWDRSERARVLAYLRRGEALERYMGFSECRICGEIVDGTGDMSDGAWVWPEGLPHYIEAHDVRLPAEFVAHALGKR